MIHLKRLTTWLIVSTLATTVAVPVTSSGQTGGRSSSDFGRSTFVDKGCAGCHAVYGFGIGGTKPSGGPDLGKRDVYGTRLELASRMWNHFPNMLKKVRKQGGEFPSFTEAEVKDVLTYLAFIRYRGEPGNERTGRKLLHEKKCTSCHTFGGQGGDIGPDFSQTNDYLTPLSLAAAMWNHGPSMEDIFEDNDIKRPKLNGREIVDLWSGIQSFMVTSRVPPGTDRPGDPAEGAMLIESKGCTYCHGPTDRREDAPIGFEALKVDASVTEIAGDMWNHGPDMWAMMEEDTVSFPTLTPIEMADIISFLYSQRLQDPPGSAERGADLIYEKGCISCHSIDGKGAGAGPSFSDIDPMNSSLSMISRMWNHAEDMDQKVRELGRDWPKFTGEELGDIYAYVQSLAGSK